MQKAWKSSSKWDDELSILLIKEWETLQNETIATPIISIPRHVFFSIDSACLHAFSDASEKAYGTCVYITSACHSHIVFSRNRLSPTKSVLTTPRLELMGALLSV